MQPNTPNDGKTEEGLAIMSKYPIISHNFYKLFMYVLSVTKFKFHINS